MPWVEFSRIGADGAQGPPGVAGRDGVIVGGVKINTSTFAGASGSDPGEMYVHGVSAAGVPADVDGSLMYNSVVETLPKGIIWTSQVNNQGFLVLDLSGTGFAISGQPNADIVATKIKIEDGVATWEYDNNAAWTALSPTAVMLVIGTYEVKTAENIYQAVLSSAIALSTLIVKAGRIEVADLSAITATIGELETRVDSDGVGNTTPRLVLSDSLAPLQIFDKDDVTPLFSLTDIGGGVLQLYLLGDFASGTINTAKMFSADGIEALRGRLGTILPSSPTGGNLTIPGERAVAPTSVDTQLLDPTPPEIEHGTDDITLTFNFYDHDSGQGTPPTVGEWTIHWEVNIDSAGWVNIAGASFTFSGTVIERWLGDRVPPHWVWTYLLNVIKVFVYTPPAGTDFEFRMNSIKNSGLSANPRYLSASADEPIVGTEVTELIDLTDVNTSVPTNRNLLIADGVDWESRQAVAADIPNLAASKITSGVFVVGRIPNLAASKITSGVFAAGRIPNPVANSTLLGGLATQTGGSPPSGSQILKSHTNGYTYLGWLNTVSGSASSVARIYCSQDAYLRYMTPQNFVSAIDNYNFNFSGLIQKGSKGIAYWITAGQTVAKMSISTSAASGGANGDIHYKY